MQSKRVSGKSLGPNNVLPLPIDFPFLADVQGFRYRTPSAPPRLLLTYACRLQPLPELFAAGTSHRNEVLILRSRDGPFIAWSIGFLAVGGCAHDGGR